MKFLRQGLPLILVLIGLATPLENLWKAALILAMTLVVVWPLTKKELGLYLFVNIFFILNDLGAIHNGFFAFTKPDLWGLPTWEFVAWGFWVMCLYRLLPSEFPLRFDFRWLVGAVVFSQCFALITNRVGTLAATSGILAAFVLVFKDKSDLKWLAGYALLGLFVEAIGLYFDLWVYPDANQLVACLQFLVMWAGVGLFFRNLVGPFFCSRT